jgi:4-hydroxy-3-methylbut-2-enyl diphosphate reductase
MIHNPQVNKDLMDRGVTFLQDTYGKQLISFDSLSADDVVIIPAFGTTLDIEQQLRNKGIAIEQYNTTCPFVEKVWNRSEQIAQKGFSIVIHGKPKHEETRATFSHASSNTPTIVVNDMAETIELAKYITEEKDTANFYEEFKGRYSEGFDINRDLQRIGVVNQTTQLATDTQAISDFLKETIQNKYQLTEGTIGLHFADTRDTLCYATNDNQTAVTGMLSTSADIAIVIGGHNSSNSSHLVELCEHKLPTYFIDAPERLESKTMITHCNWQTKTYSTIQDYLPSANPLKILMTSGASCPDAIVEQVIRKLAAFYNVEDKVDEFIQLYS